MRGRRITVEVDLREDWSTDVIAAGFESSACTAWIAEGLIPYLSNRDAERLLVTVSELSRTGSRLALDHAALGDDSLLSQARAIPTMDEITAMWKGGLGEAAVGSLRRHTWQVDTVDDQALAAKYGRQRPSGSNASFLTAKRL